MGIFNKKMHCNKMKFDLINIQYIKTTECSDTLGSFLYVYYDCY